MEIWPILGGAFASGITAALATGGVLLTFRGKKHAKRRQQLLPICAIVPMIVAMPAAGPMGDVLEDVFNPPQTRMEAVLRYYARKAFKDPVLAERFRGLDKVQANALGQKLAREGLAYLDDEALQRRTELVVELLRNGSRELAAGLYTGKLDPASMQEALEHVHPKDRDAWVKLSFQAMKAAIKGGTKVTITAAQQAAALQALAAKLEPSTGARLLEIMGNSTPTVSEAAFACTTLFENMYRLDPENRRVLNRAMANF
jgi:hypothetical protein